MHGIPSIGVNMHIDGTEEWEDEEADIVRENCIDVDFADLRLLAYAPDGASYEYYTDDGETRDYDKPEHFVHITLDADGNAKSDRATVKVEG